MRKNWKFLGWYYRQGGERIGPVPPEEMDRLIARGQLRPSDEVEKAWKDANNQIRFFGNQAGLSPFASSVPSRVGHNNCRNVADFVEYPNGPFKRMK